MHWRKKKTAAKKHTSINQKRLQTSYIIPEIKEILHSHSFLCLCMREREIWISFCTAPKDQPFHYCVSMRTSKKHWHKTSNSTLTFLTRLCAVIGNRGCKPQNKRTGIPSKPDKLKLSAEFPHSVFVHTQKRNLICVCVCLCMSLCVH